MYSLPALGSCAQSLHTDHLTTHPKCLLLQIPDVSVMYFWTWPLTYCKNSCNLIIATNNHLLLMRKYLFFVSPLLPVRPLPPLASQTACTARLIGNGRLQRRYCEYVEIPVRDICHPDSSRYGGRHVPRLGTQQHCRRQRKRSTISNTL